MVGTAPFLRSGARGFPVATATVSPSATGDTVQTPAQSELVNLGTVLLKILAPVRESFFPLHGEGIRNELSKMPLELK